MHKNCLFCREIFQNSPRMPSSVKRMCCAVVGRRRLYWNDCSESGTLETSALDGQGRRTLLRGIGCVLSLTIDLPLQTIYWVNMFGPGIGYCPLSNCTRVQLRYVSYSGRLFLNCALEL